MTSTVAAVEALGRRVVAAEADVRDQAQLDAAVARGIAELAVYRRPDCKCRHLDSGAVLAADRRPVGADDRGGGGGGGKTRAGSGVRQRRWPPT